MGNREGTEASEKQSQSKDNAFNRRHASFKPGGDTGDQSDSHNTVERGEKGLESHKPSDRHQGFKPGEASDVGKLRTEGEQIHDNPDARTAFENVLTNLGRPLNEDAVKSPAKFGDTIGLDNGMREGTAFGWRLEWDPNKGAHFNWFDWTEGDKSNGKGRWGAETFPASKYQINDMILHFNLGGVKDMLNGEK